MLGRQTFEIVFEAKSADDLAICQKKLAEIKAEYNKGYMYELVGKNNPIEKFSTVKIIKDTSCHETISKYCNPGFMEVYLKIITPYINIADAFFVDDDNRYDFHFNMNNSHTWSSSLNLGKNEGLCFGNIAAELHFGICDCDLDDRVCSVINDKFNLTAHRLVENVFYADFSTNGYQSIEDLYDILKELTPKLLPDSFVLLRDNSSNIEDSKYRKLKLDEDMNWISYTGKLCFDGLSKHVQDKEGYGEDIFRYETILNELNKDLEEEDPDIEL